MNAFIFKCIAVVVAILLGFVTIFLLVVTGFVGVLWMNSVSDDEIRGVKIGMTEAEVIQVMGTPYSDSSQNQKTTHDYHFVWSRGFGRVAVVKFSPAGLVTEAFND